MVNVCLPFEDNPKIRTHTLKNKYQSFVLRLPKNNNNKVTCRPAHYMLAGKKGILFHISHFTNIKMSLVKKTLQQAQQQWQQQEIRMDTRALCCQILFLCAYFSSVCIFLLYVRISALCAYFWSVYVFLVCVCVFLVCVHIFGVCAYFWWVCVFLVCVRIFGVSAYFWCVCIFLVCVRIFDVCAYSYFYLVHLP